LISEKRKRQTTVTLSLDVYDALAKYKRYKCTSMSTMIEKAVRMMVNRDFTPESDNVLYIRTLICEELARLGLASKTGVESPAIDPPEVVEIEAEITGETQPSERSAEREVKTIETDEDPLHW